jgi:hypothetical protein
MNKKQIELIRHFEKIRNLGWIETKRHGDQMLGNTFEDLIGKHEDNLSVADWHGIEIKTQREKTTSMMSLFTKSPSYPKRANTYLREKFGIDDEKHGKKILNSTISGDNFNTHRGGFGFKLDVDEKSGKILLKVKDLKTEKILEEDIYWDFKVIENALTSKLKMIALIYGDEKKENERSYVRYNKMTIIKGLTLEKMLLAITNGDLKMDFRIGVYMTGVKTGKTHDHGSGFRIKIDKLIAYAEIERIL